MQPHQTHVRKMRQERPRERRNEPRQTYYDPVIRRAKRAARNPRSWPRAV